MTNSYTAVINQAIVLLDGLSNTEYQKVIKPHFPSSVGAHIRHVIDHFLALINGVEQGHINYNVRHRHNNVEQSVDAGVKALEEISTWLSRIDESLCEQSVLVTSEIDVSHTKSATCKSSVERELVFASSHAIHHYALIRIICAMQNKSIPEFFGYAPATITHLNRSA
ncbi:DinB family protein [Glaciecola siphonariae]|uniref:DinB family protein n=1 Tax=Glaciecola siphonariae TaxID=521012 RepID=A0ABV9M008_9ALTE